MSLNMSPPATPEAKNTILKPKGLEQRARMNVGWLDSSLSIMEQGVREFDTLCLRYKYFNFYDLNTKFDSSRINQYTSKASESSILCVCDTNTSTSTTSTPSSTPAESINIRARRQRVRYFVFAIQILQLLRPQHQ